MNCSFKHRKDTKDNRRNELEMDFLEEFLNQWLENGNKEGRLRGKVSSLPKSSCAGGKSWKEFSQLLLTLRQESEESLLSRFKFFSRVSRVAEQQGRTLGGVAPSKSATDSLLLFL